MDLSQYKALKEKGTVALAKVGSRFCIVADRYDQDTGQKVDNAIIEVKRETVGTMIDELQNRVLCLKELLRDMDEQA